MIRGAQPKLLWENLECRDSAQGPHDSALQKVALTEGSCWCNLCLRLHKPGPAAGEAPTVGQVLQVIPATSSRDPV